MMSTRVSPRCCLLSLLIVVLVAGFYLVTGVLAQDQGCDGRRAAQPGDCTNAQLCSSYAQRYCAGASGAKENVQKLSLECVSSPNQNCISVTRDCYDEVDCKWNITKEVCEVKSVKLTHTVLARNSELCIHSN